MHQRRHQYPLEYCIYRGSRAVTHQCLMPYAAAQHSDVTHARKCRDRQAFRQYHWDDVTERQKIKPRADALYAVIRSIEYAKAILDTDEAHTLSIPPHSVQSPHTHRWILYTPVLRRERPPRQYGVCLAHDEMAVPPEYTLPL